MAKTTGGDLGAAELDAAIAELQRQLTALQTLKRARQILEERTAVQRELMRRARSNLDAAETEARDSGALAIVTAMRKDPAA